MGKRLTGRARQARNRRILSTSDICWICGKPGADSVDHVIPIARGGTEDPSNLRPAHLHPCNRAKSDKDFAANIIKRSGALE
jgi:5-methylcytosine-specific restriction endonuclease McrA